MSQAKIILAALLTWSNVAFAGAYKFVTLDFPPLEYEGEKGEAAGAAVDIVREVMTKLKHTVSIEVLPWTRSLQLAKEGKASAIFTAYKNAERETFLDYGNEVLIPQVVSLYVKKGSSLTYKGDPKELVGKTIGIISTISYGQVFDQAREKLQLRTERVESLDLNFKKLIAGRLDFVISNRYSAEVEIENLKLGEVVVELAQPVEIMPSYIAFSKKSRLTALRDDFDKTLRLLKRSGRYQEILAKYRVHAPSQ